MAEVDRTLYSGTISAPRELKALQDELASLRRRQRMLEDDQIELMEVIEPIQADLTEIDDESANLRQESERLGEALSRAEGDIDQELDTVGEQRSESVAGVSAELLEEYDRLRGRGAGVGIARLVGSNCGGCHLSLAAVEIDRIRKAAPDDLVHCEECGRLLVR